MNGREWIELRKQAKELNITSAPEGQHYYMSRDQVWTKSRCNNYMASGSCVYGIGDVPRLLRSRALVAHKFYLHSQPEGYFCILKVSNAEHKHTCTSVSRRSGGGPKSRSTVTMSLSTRDCPKCNSNKASTSLKSQIPVAFSDLSNTVSNDSDELFYSRPPFIKVSHLSLSLYHKLLMFCSDQYDRLDRSFRCDIRFVQRLISSRSDMRDPYAQRKLTVFLDRRRRENVEMTVAGQTTMY